MIMFIFACLGALIGIGITNRVFYTYTQISEEWLWEKLKTIDQHEDFRDEAAVIRNEKIPLIQQWATESIGFQNALIAIIFLNSFLLYMVSTNSHSYILNTIVAIVDAAAIVGVRTISKWGEQINGIVEGTHAVLEAIILYEAEKEVYEDQYSEDGSSNK